MRKAAAPVDDMDMRLACVLKWDASAPYFPVRCSAILDSVEEALDVTRDGPIAFCIYGRLPRFCTMADTFLVECVGYENGMAHLFGIRRKGEILRLHLPQGGRRVDFTAPVTVALVATDTEPYRQQLRDAVEHYAALGLRMMVVWYGERTPDCIWNQPNIGWRIRRLEDFSMAKARNLAVQGLRECETPYVLLCDLDFRFTAEQIEEMKSVLTYAPSGGVLNLKANPVSGNGNYFGERAVMARNHHDERFVRYWREDTEYLMNFSRIGILPTVLIRGAYHHPAQIHARDATWETRVEGNFELMTQIIHGGR